MDGRAAAAYTCNSYYRQISIMSGWFMWFRMKKRAAYTCNPINIHSSSKILLVIMEPNA